MKPPLTQLSCVLALALSSCATPQPAPTQTAAPPPTSSQPSQTPTPTEMPNPTETAPPKTATATPTPVPQPLLLRRACGRDYVVRANEAIEVFYGGWGVRGIDLARQWATALTIDLTIDGLPVEGHQQPPAADLPYNCPKDVEDSFWLYYSAVIPQLAPGTHHVNVTFNALRALPDGYAGTYGPGQIARQTFRVTAQ